MFAPVVAAERWTRAQVFSFQIGHSIQWGTKPTRAKNDEEALSRVGSSTDDWHKRRASQLLNMRFVLLLDRLQQIAPRATQKYDSDSFKERGAKKMDKLCSNCKEKAQYSIVVTISTVGVSPRIQSYSTAVLFCEKCFRELRERLCSEQLQEAVNSALTELTERVRENSSAQKSMFD